MCLIPEFRSILASYYKDRKILKESAKRLCYFFRRNVGKSVDSSVFGSYLHFNLSNIELLKVISYLFEILLNTTLLMK